MLKRYKILTLKKIHPPVWQMRRVKIVKRVGLTIVVLLLPMPCIIIIIIITVMMIVIIIIYIIDHCGAAPSHALQVGFGQG